MNLQISSVKENERDILANMLGYYLYDLNEIFSEQILFEFQVDGNLHYPNLDLYWREDTRFAYLFRINNTLVGCGLVHKNPFFNTDQNVHVIAEFYVAKMYRRHGIGMQAAIKMMQFNPG
jgi:predicted acetyltransferase